MVPLLLQSKRCVQPEGYVTNSDDCDDTEENSYPEVMNFVMKKITIVTEILMKMPLTVKCGT